MGDAVWEGQMPAALQTLFDASSGKQVHGSYVIMVHMVYMICYMVLLTSFDASSGKQASAMASQRLFQVNGSYNML
jgi:hypothetical protein